MLGTILIIILILALIGISWLYSRYGAGDRITEIAPPAKDADIQTALVPRNVYA